MLSVDLIQGLKKLLGMHRKQLCPGESRAVKAKIFSQRDKIGSPGQIFLKPKNQMPLPCPVTRKHFLEPPSSPYNQFLRPLSGGSPA
jgi:hypothetical protein